MCDVVHLYYLTSQQTLVRGAKSSVSKIIGNLNRRRVKHNGNTGGGQYGEITKVTKKQKAL